MQDILPSPLKAGRCGLCGASSLLISRQLRVCAVCIRTDPDRALPLAAAAHRRARRLFRLPEQPPRSAEGIPCSLCAQECRMAEGERGYCNLRENRGGRMAVLAGGPDAGILHWYYDPLPTNCVAMDVCGERGTSGKDNLAVFYGACALNCLFCQNWHYMQNAAALSPRVSAVELADAATARVACLCYFGGDPAPQVPHALAVSRLVGTRGRVRICWETSGTMHPAYLRRVVDVSLASGGTVKFDLKAHSEALHIALTGFSNRRTLQNFAAAAARAAERPDPPLVVASTPLVPGYVDVEEVGAIARFVASLDRGIPYRLLAFYPSFLMDNLPTTSRAHAQRCLDAARNAGLQRVALGNVHLLGDLY
ncbi:MAG: radical SAM protein [Armatimonadota bacterium]|nr:radical SAM protein [Armatimonadota bacterium]